MEIHRLERWREKALLGIDNGLRVRNGDPLNEELDAAVKRISFHTKTFTRGNSVWLIKNDISLDPMPRYGGMHHCHFPDM